MKEKIKKVVKNLEIRKNYVIITIGLKREEFVMNEQLRKTK